MGTGQAPKIYSSPHDNTGKDIFECTLLWNTKSNNIRVQTANMTTIHGRLHISNLPWEWSWQDIRQFVGQRGIPKPNFVKQFGDKTHVAQHISTTTSHYYGPIARRPESRAPLTGHAFFCPKKPYKRTVCETTKLLHLLWFEATNGGAYNSSHI